MGCLAIASLYVVYASRSHARQSVDGTMRYTLRGVLTNLYKVIEGSIYITCREFFLAVTYASHPFSQVLHPTILLRMSCFERVHEHPLWCRMLRRFLGPIVFILEWILPYALVVFLGMVLVAGIALACDTMYCNCNKREQESRKRESRSQPTEKPVVGAETMCSTKYHQLQGELDLVKTKLDLVEMDVKFLNKARRQ